MYSCSANSDKSTNSLTVSLPEAQTGLFVQAGSLARQAAPGT